MSTPAQRTAYHHGDLPSALVDAALELIAEHGTHGFTVVEAARRTGVSTSAPYRHFASRDALLAAVATRAYGELLRRFEAAFAGEARPADQLAAAAGAYVRFAAERRPMFEVLFGAGLEKARYPELQQAAGALLAAVWAVASQLAPGGDDELTGRLVQAVTGVAQGHATLLLDGGFDAEGADGGTSAGAPRPEPAAVALAEERARAATRALLRGRQLLFEGG